MTTNRANDLLFDVLRSRYPKLFSDFTKDVLLQYVNASTKTQKSEHNLFELWVGIFSVLTNFNFFRRSSKLNFDLCWRAEITLALLSVISYVISPVLQY